MRDIDPNTLPPSIRAGTWRPTPRRQGLRHVAIGLAALVLPMPGLGRATTTDTVRMAGNGGAMGAMRRVAEAYQARTPSTRIVMLSNLGSSGGIAAMLAGATDLAIATRMPDERERAAGVVAIRYARTPLCFATHPGVAEVAGVTLDDAARIFAGDLAQWPDGAAIRPIRRPHNDGMALALAGASPAMQRAMEALQRRSGITTAGNDQDNAEALEAVSGAFGAITLAQGLTERRRCRLLALDAVEPSVTMLVAGRYPLAIELFALVRDDAPPATRAFLDFLRGPEGRSVLLESGHEAPAAPRTPA